MSQLRARLRDPSRRARGAVEYQLDQLSHAARADKKNSAESKNPVQAAPPVHAWALDKQHTALGPGYGFVCARRAELEGWGV